MHSLGLPPAQLNFQFFVCHVFLDFFKVWTHYDVDRSGYIESNELEVRTNK